MINLKYMFILGLIAFVGCKPEEMVDTSTLIKIDISNDTIPANSESETTVQVKIPKSSSKANSKVTLECSNGTFDNGSNTIQVECTKAVDNDKIGTATYISGINLTASTITASVVGLEKSASVQFIKEYPTRIKTTLAQFSITDFYAPFSIKTKLQSNIGQPTLGNNIDIKVVDANGMTYGHFINLNTDLDSSNEVENKLILAKDSCFCDELYIETSVTGESNIIRDRTKVLLK